MFLVPIPLYSNGLRKITAIGRAVSMSTEPTSCVLAEGHMRLTDWLCRLEQMVQTLACGWVKGRQPEESLEPDTVLLRIIAIATAFEHPGPDASGACGHLGRSTSSSGAHIS